MTAPTLHTAAAAGNGLPWWFPLAVLLPCAALLGYVISTQLRRPGGWGR